MIIVEGLERRYGALRAVRELSFTIERGEVVGLLGQNGAGKTTCMKMITGYIDPSAGRVSVGGLDIVEDRLAAQQLIGYLPESAPLYPDMLVEEYLRLIADLRGVSEAELEGAVRDALEATGLTERRLQLIGTLSKGYRQRVGLAQAIVHRPQLLILDEPTNGLDPLQITEIRALIKRLAEDTTIFLSTHILSEIEAVCDRALILIEGELAADRSLAELKSSSEIELLIQEEREDQDDQERDKLNLVEALSALEQVESVRCRDQSSHLSSHLISYRGAPEVAITEITRLALERGALIGGVSVHTQSLESAFRELLAHHAESAAERKQAKTSVSNERSERTRHGES